MRFFLIWLFQEIFIISCFWSFRVFNCFGDISVGLKICQSLWRYIRFSTVLLFVCEIHVCSLVLGPWLECNRLCWEHDLEEETFAGINRNTLVQYIAHTSREVCPSKFGTSLAQSIGNVLALYGGVFLFHFWTKLKSYSWGHSQNTDQTQKTDKIHMKI